MQQPQTLLAFSDQLYQRFLRAYPTEYRRGFSDEMAQVFRDLCREVYEQRGLAGFLELWLTTLFDLFKTAIEERLKETTIMTKNKFFRLSGWALMLAGALIMLAFAASETEASRFYSPDDPFAQFNYFSDPFGGGDILFEIAPIILMFCGMLFLTLGMHGLRLRYGAGSGNVGNISLLIATAAGAAGTLAAIPLFALIDDIWWNVWLYSFLGLFTGLSVFGMIALRNQTLPRWNALPLLASIWFPGVYLAGFAGIDLGALDFIWGATMWILIVGSIALGYMLQREEGAQAEIT